MPFVCLIAAALLPILSLFILPKDLFAWKNKNSRFLLLTCVLVIQLLLFITAATIALFSLLPDPSTGQILLPIVYDLFIVSIGLVWLRSHSLSHPSIEATRTEKIADYTTSLFLVLIALFFLFAMIAEVLSRVYFATKIGGWAAGIHQALFPVRATTASRSARGAALFPIFTAFGIALLLLPTPVTEFINRYFKHGRVILISSIVFFSALYLGAILLAYVV